MIVQQPIKVTEGTSMTQQLSADRYDAVLFDLDGVLTDTAAVHARAWKAMFDDFLQARAARHGDQAQPFTIEGDYKTYVDGKPRYDGVASVVAYEGSVRLIEHLRAQGVKLAVVSSSRNCAAVVAAAGLDDAFAARVDGVVAAERGLPGKPAPDTFLAAAADLGVRPERAVVVEDAISGVQAGRAGGFGLVVGVDREGRPDALRDNGADIVVDDLGALVP
jgi:alpha,alpha-trehalase